jgi:hypothetical protein
MSTQYIARTGKHKTAWLMRHDRVVWDVGIVKEVEAGQDDLKLEAKDNGAEEL